MNETNEPVDVLMTDGRTVPIVAAVETDHGVRFIDTLGRQFRPEQINAYQPPQTKDQP